MKTTKQNSRGEMASKEIAKKQSKKCYVEFLGQLIQVEYDDLVLFQRTDVSKMKPSVRKTVGWLISDTSDWITICYDQPIEFLPGEKWGSGFVIIKSCIRSLIVLSLLKNDLNELTYQVLGNFSPIIEENKNAKADKCN